MKIIIIRTLVGIILFSAGIAVGVPACRMYDKARAQASAGTAVSGETGTANPAESTGTGAVEADLELRVRDGDLEWYDGVRWNHAGTVSELVAADPIANPSEEWKALAARLAETRAAEQEAEMAALSRENSVLSVDEIAAARPQTSAPAVSRPTTPGAAQPAAPAPVPGNNNDNNDNNDDDGGHDEGPAPAPEPDPAPEPEPAPDDTGDGENIEWSDDYE